MDHIDQAIYDTVHDSDMPPKEIARRLGSNYQVMINKANPQNETHRLTLRESVAIQLLTGNHAIYRAMGLELSIKAEESKSLSILECVLNAGKEHGDVLSTIQKALADGRLTLREQEQCQREITEAIEALMALRKAVLQHGIDQLKG
ncbi:hypothetical protein GV054_09020 [Marinomonas mediterranea]|jgi:Phage regulatory protein CII (CP76).|uniref:Putative bacteriophage protein (GP55-like) n=1 Tax=Marinomonas mediterranea (strain ATCC 700492 / JCM 21426 / NBRC 103028 / MMB-1) TaxID=717774 RepID=F2K1E2_MARM1|nr:phage regulatory CII family protein [Marinomonas mediterranea]ADZ91073.1 putative bacteriophage protein (GP55-like) [Marinomonas mediterranea MMB-1]WCN13137.1 hypothetical protein GV054_09020 [Marinomonas mediterranea]WCN17208.1 hypothetical protein GV053_09185 [Marinomonas mediterranea MMB-1]